MLSAYNLIHLSFSELSVHRETEYSELKSSGWTWMQLTHNMRNSRHITEFAQEGPLSSQYTGTPAVLGPLVDVIPTMRYDDVLTIGLGKLIALIVNNFYTWRQSPNNYNHYIQSIRHGTCIGW